MCDFYYDSLTFRGCLILFGKSSKFCQTRSISLVTLNCWIGISIITWFFSYTFLSFGHYWAAYFQFVTTKCLDSIDLRPEVENKEIEVENNFVYWKFSARSISFQKLRVLTTTAYHFSKKVHFLQIFSHKSQSNVVHHFRLPRQRHSGYHSFSRY